MPADGLYDVKDKPKNDFIYVFAEINQPGEHKISMNKLIIDKTKLKPYFDETQPFGFYTFEECREYVFRADSFRQVQDDFGAKIQQYQFVFNSKHMHIGMAKRRNMKFDLYYDGNWIDDASTLNEQSIKTYAKCGQFMLTYDEIYLEQKIGNSMRKKVLGHNERFSSAENTGSSQKIVDYSTERIKEQCMLFSGLIMIETTVFVSHGRFISFYYFKDNQFVLSEDHFDYPE